MSGISAISSRTSRILGQIQRFYIEFQGFQDRFQEVLVIFQGFKDIPPWQTSEFHLELLNACLKIQ